MRDRTQGAVFGLVAGKRAAIGLAGLAVMLAFLALPNGTASARDWRTPAKSVSVGPYHACAVLPSGEAVCWGDNQYGKLGDGTTKLRNHPVFVRDVGGVGRLKNVTEIAAGQEHTCALRTSGQVVCWGNITTGDK